MTTNTNTHRITWHRVQFGDLLSHWEASGDGWQASINRAAGAGWEARIDGVGSYRWPEYHEGVTGKSVDDCKRWVRRMVSSGLV